MGLRSIWHICYWPHLVAVWIHHILFRLGVQLSPGFWNQSLWSSHAKLQQGFWRVILYWWKKPTMIIWILNQRLHGNKRFYSSALQNTYPTWLIANAYSKCIQMKKDKHKTTFLWAAVARRVASNVADEIEEMMIVHCWTMLCSTRDTKDVFGKRAKIKAVNAQSLYTQG